MDAQGGKTIFCKMARPGQGEGKRGQGMVRAGHREGLRGQPECFFPPQPGSWFRRESHAETDPLKDPLRFRQISWGPPSLKKVQRRF